VVQSSQAVPLPVQHALSSTSVWQAPAAVQQVLQLLALHAPVGVPVEHCPLLRHLPPLAVQSWQAAPAVPHAVFDDVVTHVPPWQHPLHVCGPHDDASTPAAPVSGAPTSGPVLASSSPLLPDPPLPLLLPELLPLVLPLPLPLLPLLLPLVLLLPLLLVLPLLLLLPPVLLLLPPLVLLPPPVLLPPLLLLCPASYEPASIADASLESLLSSNAPILEPPTAHEAASRSNDEGITEFPIPRLRMAPSVPLGIGRTTRATVLPPFSCARTTPHEPEPPRAK
jgi:hypothetical protein